MSSSNNNNKSSSNNNSTVTFYSNPYFTFRDGIDHIVLDTDDMVRVTIRQLQGEVSIKGWEVSGHHQDTTELWKDLQTMEDLSLRILHSIQDRHVLAKKQRSTIDSFLAKLPLFQQHDMPDDLTDFDAVLQQRLETMQRALLNAQVFVENKKKRFLRLRKMWTSIRNN